MTVAELIAKLQTFDQALPVVCGGFDESGFDLLDTMNVVELVPIAKKSHGPDYEEQDSLHYSDVVTGEPFSALYLDR